MTKKYYVGDSLYKRIDNNLLKSDVICLFLSSNYFASDSCMKEKNDAILLMKEKGIKLFPIILSPCLWTEYSDLKKVIAFPTDGKAVTKFANQNDAWVDVIKALKDTMHDSKQNRFINSYRRI